MSMKHIGTKILAGVLMVLLPKQKAEEKKDGFSIAIGDDLSHLNENNK